MEPSAVAPPAALPDVNEAGRVLATLDDWRALAFIMMFLVVVAVVERALASWRFAKERELYAKEREKMWEIAQNFGVNADKITDTIANLTAEVRAFRIITARVEAVTNDVQR